MSFEVVTIGNATLYRGDCLEVMASLDTVTDAIITDPPYNTTQLDFEYAVDFAVLWPELYRLSKETAWIAMFTAQPFTTDVICSNRKHYRYELIWCKTMGVGFFDANKRPLRAHENILLFCRKWRVANNKMLATYNPQFEEGKPYHKKRDGAKGNNGIRADHYNGVSDPFMDSINLDGKRHPKSWIVESIGNNGSEHPTQKPVPLIERLVASYTNPGEIVLDPYMGSGTNGVACMNLDRKFIGIELAQKHFDTACRRIEQAQQQLRLDFAA